MRFVRFDHLELGDMLTNGFRFGLVLSVGEFESGGTKGMLKISILWSELGMRVHYHFAGTAINVMGWDIIGNA